ncbi:MAG TPA: VanZ family protein [Vicinamibacterales bacterium]|nr:VanZ family protein [Vicinamibacterales bacterium]
MRLAYLSLAIALMVFAVYVSLLPFDLRPVPLGTAWAEFRTLLLDPPYRRISRVNFLANLLMFVPIGFGLTGALLAGTRRRAPVIAAAPLVVAASLAASLVAEFAQMFVPERVPSRIDIAAQTIGCLVGIVGWLVVGPELTSWLREATDRRRGNRLARGLFGYAVAWAFVNLAPFDITLDPATIARRIRTGLITLVPFGQADLSTSRLVWDAVATTISAAPLGVLGLFIRAGRRDARAAFGFGALFVAAVEAAQIFIRSHAADTADVMFGWLGVALGVWIGLRILPVPSRDFRLKAEATGSLGLPPEGGSYGIPRTGEVVPGQAIERWAVAGLAAWSLLVCMYHWMPYDFAIDNSAISRKLARMSLLPFAGYRRGSDLNALKDMLVKLGLSIPFGLIAAFVVRGRTGRLAAAAWLALAAAVFGVVEAGQLFLPGRVPDPTDVLTGVIGTGIGLWIARWLQAGHEPAARA